jgi:hypothetical protein
VLVPSHIGLADDSGTPSAPETTTTISTEVPQPPVDTEVVDTAPEIPLAVDDSAPTVLGVAMDGGWVPNDAFSSFIDISLVPVPVYAVDEFGALVGTDPVFGTTEGAGLEPGEDTDPGTNSVWYRYVSPGFEGRRGYRVSPSHQVTVYTDCSNGAIPSRGQGCEAVAPAGPTPYVRVEAGMTIWFRVVDSVGAPFQLELFRAPNVADSIAEAVALPPGSASSGVMGETYPIAGDTFSLTADAPSSERGERPNSWLTFVLNQGGWVQISLNTEDALGNADVRPIGVVLYRAPSRSRVADPTRLVELEQVSGYLEPGRYYVSIEEGEGGPTFYSGSVYLPSNAGGDVDPPTASISVPQDGATYTAEHDVPWVVEADCTEPPDPLTGEVPYLAPSITVDEADTSQLDRSVGTHVVRVTCTDAAGNSDSATATYQVLPPPLRPRLAIAGPPGGAVAGSDMYVEVTVSHPGGTTDPVPAGFEFEVNSRFTASFTGARELPSTLSCSSGAKEIRCVSSVGLSPGGSVRARFAVRTPAMGPHAACEEVDEQGFSQLRTDVAGPVCVNVSAYVPGAGVMVSVPLDGGFLRFDATAVDDGTTVTLRVRPRNAGTRDLTGLGFLVAQHSPGSEELVIDGTTAPAGWTCGPGPLARGLSSCTSPTATLRPGEVGPAIVLRFASPTSAPVSCPQVYTPMPTPAPSPCGGVMLYWASADANSFTIAGYVRYRIGGPDEPPPTGPCVIVETPEVDFGEVTVGGTGEVPVTIRSCSDAPVDLAVSVGDAARAGASDTWIASTSTNPAGGAFSWTVIAPGDEPSAPIAGTPRPVGDSLQPGRERVDVHRLRLGPTGPGLGSSFVATVTYVAFAP